MTDSEFLDDLERRIDQTWTDAESLRVWKMHPRYRIPPADIRAMYSRLAWRRREIITEIRTELVAAAIRRLE